MAIQANKFRILIFFLIFFQVAAMGYRNNLPSVIPGGQTSKVTLHADTPSLDESFARQTPDVLYSPEKILPSDALVSPVPTFQFGFIVVPACFLFVIFSFFTGTKVKERPFFFNNSYLHTLFSSVILINAP